MHCPTRAFELGFLVDRLDDDGCGELERVRRRMRSDARVFAEELDELVVKLGIGAVKLGDESGARVAVELERLIEQGPQTLPTLQLHGSPQRPIARGNTAQAAEPDVAATYLIDFKCRGKAAFSRRLPRFFPTQSCA